MAKSIRIAPAPIPLAWLMPIVRTIHPLKACRCLSTAVATTLDNLPPPPRMIK